MTLESETAINSAQALYDALSDDVKANVTNYQTLVDAQAALAALKNGSAGNQTPGDTVVTPEEPGTGLPVQQPEVQSDGGESQTE